MFIESLSITDFRVLAQVDLAPTPGLNVIWGDNGVGKTSILEALFLAGRGRSFRHREAGPFIRTGSCRARVVVRSVDDAGCHHVLGIERGAREQVVRYDGEQLSRRSEQVRALPLQLLTPNSHALIEGPPELRRRYLDQGLFHVEQEYPRHYSDYQRALRQRNAALRSQPSIARSWDQALAAHARVLDSSRSRFVQQLATVAVDILARIAPGMTVQVRYRPGWHTDADYVGQLAERWHSDVRQGFTGIGPHRADIQIRASQADAAKRLSRGQQKMVLLALILAQATIQQATAHVSPILLLDDLPAELDRAHRDRVVSELAALGLQAFITTVERDSLPVGSDWGVFHVEQGGRLAG
jgi:DNA replication and repair protein RecF